MKKQFLYLLIMPLIALFAQSCEKRNFADGELSPYILVEDVRMAYRNADIVLTSDVLAGAEKTVGVVISDHSTGNVPEGMVILQQNRGTLVHGIALRVGAQAVDYAPGDSIMVRIEGKTLKKDGFLYVDNVGPSDIEKLKSGARLNIRNTTGSAVYQRPHDFESTLVRIYGAEMTPTPLPGDTFEGTKQFYSGAELLHIRTRSTASFASTQIPEHVNVTGVLLGEPGDESRLAIWPRYNSDILDVSDPGNADELGSYPIIITGMCVDPTGGDSNHEYIQLKANVDIDFSQIPFSVVTCNNAGANAVNGSYPQAGWANGGNQTFKFNLTEGTVKKGEYFYVGSGHKRINGINSASIAEANWIRSFMYTAEGGDGLGDPAGGSANLLGNSGNPTGIAVFAGTNVGESSVPLDVVFYGGFGTATVIAPDGSMGYRITNTDYYSTIDLITGDPTPFFSMGNGRNDARFTHHGSSTAAPNGYFFQLGGTFDMTEREWITPRQQTIVILDIENSKLSDIEEGPGATVQID